MRTILTELEEAATSAPDTLFLRFRAEDLTYRDLEQRVRCLSAGLRQQGIVCLSASHERPPLPSLLPNGSAAVELWFACNRNGIVWAPLNTEFRGRGLAHAIQLTGSPDLVVAAELLPPLVEIADELTLERVFVMGCTDSVSATPDDTPFELLAFETLQTTEPDGEAAYIPESPTEASLLIYTSGTTGTSKACELSHHYVLGQADLAIRYFGLAEDDVLFCPYPLFHWDATIGTVTAALLLRSTAVITERFSVSRFWDDVRHFDATVFDFMGATLSFLWKQAPRLDDLDNPARLGWGVPMPVFKSDFERRFGVSLVEGYGSTEGGVMVFQHPDEVYPTGSCGRACPEYEVVVLDDDDTPCPAGQIGEIAVRPKSEQDRHLMMTGYYGQPEANAEAFRGGYFHTGDFGRLDEHGNLFFEGRKKDAIRRRGENISAFEIEEVIEQHPAVLEVAAYGVPSEDTEEDVAVSIVVRDGDTLDEDQLRTFCGGRMAGYMVPQHVRFLERLPKTPTEKIEKLVLKKQHADLLAEARSSHT